MKYFRVHGKGGKIRYVPCHSGTLERIDDYLILSCPSGDDNGALFRPVRNPRIGHTASALTPGGVYLEVVRYMRQVGIAGENMGPHALRATAATNALENNADISHVQEWLGHANISTTQVYDRRHLKAGDSPTFRVSY